MSADAAIHDVRTEGDNMRPTPIYMVASGDLRLAANQVCWPTQKAVEERVCDAFAQEGHVLVRAHPVDDKAGHGFIYTQRMGLDVFNTIPKHARVVVVTAVWQYTHHVLGGLQHHKGPILTIGNWSGQWPGLVGLLNLNASLTKIGRVFSTLWSENFDDNFFLAGLREWLHTGTITQDDSHVHDLQLTRIASPDVALGEKLARKFEENRTIMGIFDEGCMGMVNAMIDDPLLNALGMYKERLSQSALLAAMRSVSQEEAQAIRSWMNNKGVQFVTGTNEDTDLTDTQILEQCKMYIAAVRIAHHYGCDLVGIQYQQGLKDMAPASDLAEGMMNNVDRPPVYHAVTKQELYPGQPVVHFNEVDEGAGLDALLTNRVWTELELDPATTLHDIRWGEQFGDQFVWVFEISGSAPPSHFVGGWAGASSERQPAMYFPLGGGTLKGVCRPGEIVWSRVFIMDGVLHADIGRATVVDLPPEETERRLRATTYQWPIMHAVLHGVTRNQMMARHKANHVQVAYGKDEASANRALNVKAAMMHHLGIRVHMCGDIVG